MGNDQNILMIRLIHDFGQRVIHALDQLSTAFTTVSAEEFVVFGKRWIEVFGFAIENTEVPFFEPELPPKIYL